MTASVEETLGYHFVNAPLLTAALTHRSVDKRQNNQRLEFLGDRVLGLIVCEMLYRAFPEEQEGELARRHAALVCKERVSSVAITLGLGAHLILSASEEASSGRQNISNLEDACEALIGAVYLDGGYAAATDVIERHWRPLLEAIHEPPKDPKTTLQEWSQARGMGLPIYAVVRQSGPAHAPEFAMRVSLGEMQAEASAASKRAAEQTAAGKLLEILAATAAGA